MYDQEPIVRIQRRSNDHSQDGVGPSRLKPVHASSARDGYLERAFMMAIVIIVVVLAVSSLALYAMRSKVRLKVSASLLKLASFNIEVNSDDDHKQLPPGSGP
jgi:hypothetical protein